MKLFRLSWQVGLGIIIIALCAMMLTPGAGVREIRNASSISNFPLADARPKSDDWPWWRGADGRNATASDRIRLNWSASDGEGWQAPVTGHGSASPVLWGDQLFLLAADKKAQRLTLQSYSRERGRAIWRTDLHQVGSEANSDKNLQASSSPVCDGQFVYTATRFQDVLWMTSVDVQGRIAWQKEVGPFTSSEEYQSSPMLYRSLIIVIADQDHGGYLAALHRQTGEIIWRIKRPNGDSSGTPIIATIAGRSQLIVGGKGSIASYDPATGERIWSFNWPADRVSNSIAFDADYIFATSQGPGSEVVCVRADGQGDLTESHLIWRQKQISCHHPSPICHEALLYVLEDQGRLNCLDSKTGKIEWTKTLEGAFNASPVVAGKYLICSNTVGRSYIVQTGLSGTIVAENSLSVGITASPIVAGDAIFIRTDNSLHCIASRKAESVVDKRESLKRRL